MEVTSALVENLAELSRLTFSSQEKEDIKKDLQRMISFVEKLNELDTSNVQPLLHMTDAVNIYREDQVEAAMEKTEALQNAPLADKNFFKVPKVIKNPSGGQ